MRTKQYVNKAAPGFIRYPFLSFSLDRIEDDEEDDDDEVLGDGAEGVAGRTAGGAAVGGTNNGDDDGELPPELRMDDYDDEPGLAVTGSRADGGGLGGDDSDAMDDDGEGELDGDDEEEEEEDNAEVMGVSMMEEPSTGQVFAYESEGEDSDTEDNIIKPGDHVLLTASTEEV